MEKKMEWPLSTKIAHRGLWSGDFPENSLESVNEAVLRGISVEIDVRMLRDRTLVVFHDHSLLRMTNCSGSIDSFYYDEIAPLRLAQTQSIIPKLDDVLSVINGRVPVIIECKSIALSNRCTFASQIARTMRSYDHGWFAIASFDPFLMQCIKKMMPTTLCGQHISDHVGACGGGGRIKKMLMSIGRSCSAFDPDFYVVRASALLKYMGDMERKRNKGKKIVTWDVCDDVQYERIKNIIDSEICDPQRI